MAWWPRRGDNGKTFRPRRLLQPSALALVPSRFALSLRSWRRTRRMRRCPACAGHIRDPAALRCPYCGASLPEPVTATAAATATPARLDQLGYDATSLASLDGAGFAPGEIFAARYRIVSLIGRGAMGDVYRADDLKLGQAIALKLLVPSAPAAAESLAREVRLARGIGHPNVCRVYDIGETNEWRYLSMEYSRRRDTSLTPSAHRTVASRKSA